MANSNWNKKDSARTSSSREKSGGKRGSPSGSENQGDAFETDNTRQGGMSGSSGTTGPTGLGGETSEDATSPPGGVEGTSTRDGREDPDRGSRR
ncbi:MAG: hypothetical protein WEA80_05345 [Gemmatimonadaceae bacterium]